MASEIPVFDSVDFRAGGPDMRPTLSRNVIALGLVSLCMAMSSAMIHGLLPAFLVTELGVNVLSVGAIEGIAEATTSFVKIFSGRLSDGLGRRKVLVVLGYVLSAGAKLLFPLAESASSILAARTTDRIGKGLWSPDGALYGWCRRRAPDGHRPHDAIRGQLPPGVLASGDPRFLSIAVLVIGVEEVSDWPAGPERRIIMRRSDLQLLSPVFWWAVAIAAVLALARCSQAFLLLKAGSIGIDPAFVPIVLVLMNLVFSASAYPCGMLADHISRRLQLGIGVGFLIPADLALVFAQTIWLTAIGAALWGLQMGLIQGLLSALVADASPRQVRGTAFAIYDVAVGIATLVAGIGAGGPVATFSVAASLAIAAAFVLLLRPVPNLSGH